MATVTVRINGMEYNLKGKEDEKYLQHLASSVEDKLQEILRKNTKLSVSAASILTAINLADESFKDKKAFTELLETHEILKRANKSVQEELEEIQKKHNVVITTKDTQLNKALEELKKVRETAKAYNSLKAESEKKLTNLKIDYEKKLDDVKRSSNKMYEDLKVESSRKLEDLRDRSANEFVTLKEQYEKKLENSDIKVLDLEDQLEKVIKARDIIENEKSKLEETNTILISEKQRLENEKLELQEELNSEMQNNSAESLEDEIEKLREQVGLLQAKNEKITSENNLLKKANRDLKFSLQSCKYRMIDLENKFLESQIKVAAEKAKNNPILVKSSK